MDKKKDFIDSYYKGFKQLCGVSKEDFIKYYEESKYSGFPEEAGGTVWESEGKSIYVLIRCLKPKRILEIGNFKGNSSNHILQAVEMNGEGEVTLLDIQERIEYNKLHNMEFNRVLNDSLKYLDNGTDFDLIIQDGCHEYKHVKKELQLILKNNKTDKYYIWGHDYFAKPTIECEVGKAWDEMKGQFDVFHTFKDSVSNCGFSIARKTNK